MPTVRIICCAVTLCLLKDGDKFPAQFLFVPLHMVDQSRLWQFLSVCPPQCFGVFDAGPDSWAIAHVIATEVLGDGLVFATGPKALIPWPERIVCGSSRALKAPISWAVLVWSDASSAPWADYWVVCFPWWEGCPAHVPIVHNELAHRSVKYWLHWGMMKALQVQEAVLPDISRSHKSYISS